MIGMALICSLVRAQTSYRPSSGSYSIRFESGNFDTSKRKAEFITYKGLKAMKILPYPERQTRPVTLKGFNFSNGTIEFDAAIIPGDYENELAINFHQKDIYIFETLYLRTQKDESVQRDNAIQYTPVISSVNLWDVMTPFRGYAKIFNDSWNHFKLVISDSQMVVYINRPSKPTLVVSRLEGNYKEGSLSFDGEAIFANLVISPGKTEGLPAYPGFDLTDNDPNYIRNWWISNPLILQKGSEIQESDPPADTVSWMPIESERRGLINIYRKFHSTELTSYPKQNRFVWLKTNINSTIKQTLKLDLGYSKEVFLFINKRLLYTGQNEAGKLYAKVPGGRIAVTNSTVEIPLEAGSNELLIAISSPLYGWGIMARVQNLNGLSIQNGLQ